MNSRLTLAAAIALLAGASSEGRNRAADSPPGLPFSPQAAMERVRHRFLSDGNGVLAQGNNYRLRVAEGTVAYEPLGTGSSLRIRFDRARIGERQLELPAAPACPLADGNSVAFDRGLLSESIQARGGEAEQSWVLRSPLSEDLTLLGAVEGMRFSSSGAEGLVFEDPTSGERVRYGHATVRDARGAELWVPAAFEGGAIALRVPGAFLRSAAYPVVIDPTIGPEAGLGAQVTTPAVATQFGPAVSFDGTNYLVAWRDMRLGFPPQIWGARVAPTGTVVDVDGFAIATSSAFMGDPVGSVFDGANHFLVFTSGGGAGSTEISAVRVSPSASVLDSTPLAVTAVGSSFRYQPRVARLGTNLLVVWTDFRNGSADVYGGRISPAGARQDGNGFGISLVAGSPQQVPALATDSASNIALVVWQDGRNNATTQSDIYGARVTSAGVVQEPTGVVISNVPLEQSAPTVAVNSAGRWLVAWGDARPGGGQTDVYGARAEVVSGNLSVLDSAGFAINTAANSQSAPRAFSDGTNFLVLWEDTRPGGGGGTDIWAARPQAGGTVLPDSTTGFPVSAAANMQQTLALAYDGTNFLAVWADSRNPSTTQDIYAARVPPSGSAVLDPLGIAVSTGPNAQALPAVASDGTGYLVVWADSRNGATGFDVYGTRVDATGAVLDNNGILINNNSAEQWEPSVAFSGGVYLVVWRDARNGGGNYDVYGCRVSPAGTVLDSAAVGLPIGVGALTQQAPSVAGNGTRFLVAWQAGAFNTDIQAARVSAAGALEAGSPFMISAAANGQTQPSVASDGTDFLVAWQDTRNAAANSDIYGARVSNAGTVLDGAGIPIATPPGSNQLQPAVAFGGGTYLVAWQDLRDNTTQPDIFAARVTTGGALTDGPAGTGGIAVDKDVLGQVAPAAEYDGTDFLIVWDDNRLGGNEYDLYGMRVSATAPTATALVDATKFAVSTGTNPDRFPALARGTGGQVLVVYQSSRSGVTRSYQRRYASCSLASCNDSNVCTDEVCNLDTGACAYTNNTGPCPDEGDNCTNDVCGGGACTHPAKPGCCNTAADCADGNACTSDVCSGAAGTCSNPSIPLCCNTAADCGDGNACTQDLCSGLGGTCSNPAIPLCCNTNADCTDPNLCTQDTCSGAGGLCSNSQIAGCCNSAADCNDGNACTNDACSGTGGTCTNTKVAGCCNVASDCDDSNACTTDSCSSNVCSNSPLVGCCNSSADCDDLNPCSLDTCSGVGGSCSSSPISGCCLTSADCPPGASCTGNVCVFPPDGGTDGGPAADGGPDSDGGADAGGGCGANPCGACPQGCTPTDTCDNGTWTCTCNCPDSGTQPDNDAGQLTPDGGPSDVNVKKGCGCSSGVEVGLWGLLALAVLLRRRRRD
ncbi:MAG: hypothetical protein HYZ28_16585 [Myxococcales bacterium]|nr:hypothetical protein [Myxococcales bacterium]